MEQYVDTVKRLLEEEGLSFDEKKPELVENGLFKISATRALNDFEKKLVLKKYPFFIEAYFKKSRLHCSVLIKLNNKADKEKICFWKKRYRKAILRPEIYFVSRDGFEESAVKYVKRYGGPKLITTVNKYA